MSDALHGLVVLLQLRLRHARAEIVRWFYVMGSDFRRDTGVVDRMYQAYAVILVVACVAFLWFYLLSVAALFGESLDYPAAIQGKGLAYVVPVAVFAMALARYLRVPLIKMTHPDIAWLANTLSPGAWALSGLLSAVVRAFIWGILIGFVAGVALRTVVSPASMGVTFAMGLVCAVGLAWLLGAMRHVSFTRGPQRGPRFDMGSVVRANSLYADLQPLHSWAIQSPGAYEEARRRRIMAKRRPVLGLPDAGGRRLLLARAALSHVRQREGIVNLVIWGGLIVPAGAVLTASEADGSLVLVWVALAGMFAVRAKEMTRVYGDDCRVRLVGDAIECPRFELLVLDSLPAAGFAFALSLVVLAVAFALLAASAGQVLAAVFIAASSVAALVFAGGIESTGPKADRALPGFEIVVVGYALAMALASIAGPVWAAIAACACAVALGTWCWAGAWLPQRG